MANYKTVFLGTETSKTESVELQCFSNSIGEIYIQLEDTSVSHDYGIQYISIDISTAIKLSKTLRTHINIVKEDL